VSRSRLVAGSPSHNPQTVVTPHSPTSLGLCPGMRRGGLRLDCYHHPGPSRRPGIGAWRLPLCSCVSHLLPGMPILAFWRSAFRALRLRVYARRVVAIPLTSLVPGEPRSTLRRRALGLAGRAGRCGVGRDQPPRGATPPAGRCGSLPQRIGSSLLFSLISLPVRRRFLSGPARPADRSAAGPGASWTGARLSAPRWLAKGIAARRWSGPRNHSTSPRRYSSKKQHSRTGPTRYETDDQEVSWKHRAEVSSRP